VSRATHVPALLESGDPPGAHVRVAPWLYLPPSNPIPLALR